MKLSHKDGGRLVKITRTKIAILTIICLNVQSYSTAWAAPSPPMIPSNNGGSIIQRPLALGSRHGITLGSYAQLWYAPLNLKPLVPGTSPSEGTWQPIGTSTGAGNATFVTYVTPYLGAPQVAVAWINQSYARLSLFAGTSQPGGTWPNEGSIPQSLFPSLIGAFEGGFLFNQSNGGWYEAGSYGAPLKVGAASIVNYTNGTIDVGSWGTDVTMAKDVYAVRQNLIPLVENSQVLPSANENPLITWGYSLGNLLYTWRSGLGITSNGALIWAGGPGLSPEALGQVLVWAGAVRGMQLDMNPDWVNYSSYTYNPTTGISGRNLLNSMYFPPTHYLSPFWRDFVGVFLR